MRKKITILGATVGVCAALIAVPASASAAPDTWGQEVKDCNATSCYAGETNRGAYVSGQATDEQTPGYAYEIQNLALSPRDLGNGGF
jgi:hypothetical protein